MILRNLEDVLIIEIKTSARILTNAKMVIKFFKYRHVPRAALERLQKDSGNKVYSLVLPIGTRWSSNAHNTHLVDY